MKLVPGLVAVLLAVGSAPSARAEGETVDLAGAERTQVRPLEVVLLPVLGAGMLVTGLTATGTTTPSWRGRNGFDDGIRDALRGGETTRDVARITSDVLFIGMSLYPVVVDTFVLAGGVHRRWDVALRIAVTYGEAGLSAGLLTVLSQGLVGRGRPLVDRCAENPDYDPMCDTNQLSRSFFAGHNAAAFNAAGVVCQNQVDWELYGSRAGGIAACAGTLTLATATGVLRIVADKHWASDVLVGTGVGLGTGLFVPWLVRRINGGDEPAVKAAPVFTPSFRGAAATAVF